MAISSTTSAEGVTYPMGFKAAGVRCGLKSKNRDLALIVSDVPAAAAGVFTTNLIQASSIPYSKKIVQGGVAQAILVNAGNANACTGAQGAADTTRMAELAAKALNLPTDQVLVASTGIIGRQMDMSKIEHGVPAAAAALSTGEEIDANVSEAILTTDTCPKQLAVEVTSAHWSGVIRIGATTKGSGMIAPNMATTLGFVTTDAKLEPKLLQRALKSAIDVTFNRITVDGDTSTNDMVLLLANGASGIEITEGPAYCEFLQALEEVLLHLAKAIARDGEGATKLVCIQVTGASSSEAANQVAKTVAESPLVKTALFGNDPNWGRIIAAAGRAGEPFEPDQASVHIGPHQVFGGGEGLSFDKVAAHQYLKSPEISVEIGLGDGQGQATFWTCDYSYDYIRINAEYHT